MSNFFISLLRFVSAVFLLPVVIACTISFNTQLGHYPGSYDEFFLWGVLAFLLIFLFIYEFWGVYDFGQSIIRSVLKFTSPLDKFLANLIPFYLTIILFIFYCVKVFASNDHYDLYFMFFSGFSIAMHILLVAQELQQNEKSAIKPSYFFLMFIVFISSIFLFVVVVDFITGDSTFANFFSEIVDVAKNVYKGIFDRIGIKLPI